MLLSLVSRMLRAVVIISDNLFPERLSIINGSDSSESLAKLFIFNNITKTSVLPFFSLVHNVAEMKILKLS